MSLLPLDELAASINTALPGGVTLSFTERPTRLTIEVVAPGGAFEHSEMNMPQSPRVVVLSALDAAIDFLSNVYSAQWPRTENGRRPSAWVDLQLDRLRLGYRDESGVVLELPSITLRV